MSRGTRQLPQNGNSSTQSQSSPQSSVRRGNKTLGWYMSGLDALDGGKKEVNKSQQHMVAQRKASLQDATTKSAVNNEIEDQRKARSKQRFVGNQINGGRQRANSSSLCAAKSTPARRQQTNGQSVGSKEQIDVKKANAKFLSGKENYWYYDHVSNGYYYEHNGTRGWRKNNPKMENLLRGMEEAQKLEQQKTLKQKKEQQALLDCRNNLPSLLNGQQLSKLIPQATMSSTNSATSNAFNNSPMAIKYYDNDGYFYEMGSVDGWRRRPPGATPPGATSPFQTKRGGGGNVNMSATQIYDQQTPRRKPLHYQSYQQPAPHLGGLDLQEVAAAVAIAQQQNINHQQNNCCGGGSVACCCLTAAIAAQLVLKQQQQMMAANNKRENKMKCSSDIHSLIDDSITKTHDFSELNTQAALKRLAGNISQPISLGTNWQVPSQRSKWSSPINEEKTTPTTITGSGNGLVDDPADELGIEANALLQQKRPSIAPIGSEAFAAQEAKRASLGCVVTTMGTTKCNNTNVTKRPDSLRLAPETISSAYESISPGEILRKNNNNNFGGESQPSQRDFDVDKFIADSIPMPLEPERLLNSLRNPQRTPHGPLVMPHSFMNNNNNNTNEPITADSPLFTPILPGKNPWSSTYRTSHANPWAYP
uniref:WW domain-containing protein n=1 Tax=Meloidogyne javanica TaxID=6303 RepID=A0A915MHS1_MELJA